MTKRVVRKKRIKKRALKRFVRKLIKKLVLLCMGIMMIFMIIHVNSQDGKTSVLHMPPNSYEDYLEVQQSMREEVSLREEEIFSYTVSASLESTPAQIEVKTEEEPEVQLEGIHAEVTLNRKARNKVVVVDPGHGGRDFGAVYGGVNEKDVNLDISLRLYEILKERGIKVYMTRTEDKFVPLTAIAEYANRLNASLFVSIHNNAMADRNFDGTITLYFPTPANPQANLSGRRAAQIIQAELVNRIGTTDRGLQPRRDLHVLRRTNMPAVLAEVAHMTNAKDLQNLKKDTFRQQAAEALYIGIIKALNESVE